MSQANPKVSTSYDDPVTHIVLIVAVGPQCPVFTIFGSGTYNRYSSCSSPCYSAWGEKAKSSVI